MSDELIRKSEVLELIDSLNISDRQNYEDLIFNIEDMTPVNAVELPCKIGDKIYELCKMCNAVHEYEVVGYRYKYEMVFIECDMRELTDKDIGVIAFLTREEAERALEELKNE